MTVSIITALLLITFAIIFLVYKRHMIVKLLSLDFTDQVKSFEKDIQSTATVAVDKLTRATDDLEYLLEQSQETIEELKIRCKIAEEQLYKYSLNEIKQNVVYKTNAQQIITQDPIQQSFAQHFIKASYNQAPHLETKETLPEETISKVILQEQANTKQEELSKNVIDFPTSKVNIDMAEAEPKFRQKQILRLAASGYDDTYIAQTLRLGISEVKLTRKAIEK